MRKPSDRPNSYIVTKDRHRQHVDALTRHTTTLKAADPEYGRMTDRRGTVAKLITMTDSFYLQFILIINSISLTDHTPVCDPSKSQLLLYTPVCGPSLRRCLLLHAGVWAVSVTKMQTTHLCMIRPVCLTKFFIAVIELLQVLNCARSEVVNEKRR